ncbi:MULTISPECIES: helix-turn-helix domain-containing protein [Rhodococcus]|jgi:transcriptional regulator with XRE-family HTH domain|uniref:XRE family transcriptional regulator n=1 Tax=Nocardia globerula TaxID=1818 RepID=A0A652YR68_NOCGL|nr:MULTISPECIES: XRE family transcriptional regulator [Rhodococcus]NMD63450.1 helix-turn-helix domain-containing protein [Nocardia globerula]PVX63015.1 XRE family transcriptional regulator [Rhodococcus globerulus]ROZ43248.1 transcriptional regulator [Rhodococcus sp. WS3]
MTTSKRSVHRDTGDPAPEQREVPADTPTGLDLEKVIAAQVRKLRLASGLSVGDMATRVGISKAMLSKIENAQTSCSLSTLARLAAGLDVPVTSLFRGADAKRDAVFVEAGHGAEIVGRGTRVGHHYELLGALRGQNKRLEPVLVTLTDASEVFPLFQHPGTELLYMLEGEMIYGHGDSEYRLRPGDSLLLDGEGLHGPNELVQLPIRFLAVTAYPDNHQG